MNDDHQDFSRTNSLITILLLTLALSGTANATTYFIDAETGSDAWSGTAATKAAAPSDVGPWQTLARASGASFVPGDQILLKCGARWNDTLKLTASGTPAEPIVISAYPAGCATAPVIDGGEVVEDFQWRQHSGAIYKATLPLDQIRNGGFDAGTATWSSWSEAGGQTLASSTSCSGATAPCLVAQSGADPRSTLLISAPFRVTGGAAYRVSFKFNAPAGSVVRAVLRRGATPWDVLGYNQTYSGTGSWQTVELLFTASRSVSNARLYLGLPGGGTSVRVDDMRLVRAATTEVAQLLVDDVPQNIAHHPNRGHDPLAPASVYLPMNVDSDVVPGGTGSSYVPRGPELVLPAGATLTPGLQVHIRANAWTLDERRVTTVLADRLVLDSQTTAPLKDGWGYFLADALWALDSPGEWYFDPATKTVYAWMPDGLAPGARVTVASRAVGIDLTGTSNVVVDSLAVTRTGTGVQMTNTTSGVVQNTTVSDARAVGIDANGSSNVVVINNDLSRIGSNGITATRSSNRPTSGAMIASNRISDVGVRLLDGEVASLPVDSLAAVWVSNGTVSNNTIDNTAYDGIIAFSQSTLTGNVVRRACLVLDDCAAIYVSGKDNNSLVYQNLLFDTLGGLEGKPAGATRLSQGIYLDERGSGVQIIGNTVTGSTNGLLVHNAAFNRIEANTFYANQKYQLWFSENKNDVIPAGNIAGNVVVDNKLLATSAGPMLSAETSYASTAAFGSFDRNIYSTLIEPVIAVERWGAGSAASYTLPQWQAARTAGNAPRNLDPNGRAVANVGYATFRVQGASLVANGNLANGSSGWSAWNATAPFYTMSATIGCPLGTCLDFVAGASNSLLSTPTFSVVQDGLYRVSFDLRTGTENQKVTVRVRQGGGSVPFEDIAQSVILNGSIAWRRYSFIFRANETVVANDPITLNPGARLTFFIDIPFQSLSLGNMQVVPVSPVQASLKTRLVANTDTAPASIPCPDQATEPGLCGQFLRFSNSQPVTWPMLLAPKTSEIVFSRDLSLTDGDGDGIADMQDSCANTVAGAPVNAAGCAFGVTPP